MYRCVLFFFVFNLYTKTDNINFNSYVTCKNGSEFEYLAKEDTNAEGKVKLISKSMLQEIENKTITAYSFVLNRRIVEEDRIDNKFTKSYESIPTKILEDIILQCQRDRLIG